MKISRCSHSSTRPCLEALEVRALLSGAGALDPSFAGQGFQTFFAGQTTGEFSSDVAKVAGVVVQPDGKTVIGGEITSGLVTSFAVERLNADGTPDALFGLGGLYTFPLPGPSGAQRTGEATGVLLQPDGKILVFGDANQFSAGNPTGHTAVALRVNTNGTTDTTYGTNGLATYAPDPTGENIGELTAAKAGVLLPDGQLVLVGSAPNGQSQGAFGQTQSDFAAVLLNTDGSIDTTFGTNGTALVPVTANSLTSGGATGVVLQANGQLVLAGTAVTAFTVVAPPSITVTNYEGAVIRLNADGSADTTFGGATNGQVFLPPDPSNPSTLGSFQVSSATAQADGKILIGAANGPGNAVASSLIPTITRINADGTIDTTFGQSGRVTTSISGPIAVQANGQIVEAGSVSTLSSDTKGTFGRSQFAALRLNPDGSPDTTFGNTTTPGLAQYSFGSLNINPQAQALAIQPDGNIVLAGSTSVYAGNDATVDRFAVSRILAQVSTGPAATRPSPTPPASFDGSGVTNLAVYLPSIGAFAYRPVGIAIDQFVPFGIAGNGQTIPASADYSGIGQTQIAAYLPAYGLYAIRPVSGPDQVFAFGLPGVGQSIPVPADYEGTGKADVAVYLPALGAFGIRPSNGGPDEIIPFGIAGMGQSIPTPGDYFGTGQADISVYLPSLGAFAIRNPAGGPDEIIPFGIPGAGNSIPIPGDYDGSGKTELAVYFPKLGEFAYRPANGGPDQIVPFGAADGSIPVPGDYTGVGHDEVAVFDPKYGDFAYRTANGGPDVIVAFGSAGVQASLPIAATTSSNVAIANSGNLSALSIKVNASKVAVPGGPMVKALGRVASTLPAQGVASNPFG